MKISGSTIESMYDRLKERGVDFSLGDLSSVLSLIEDEIVYKCVNQLISKADAIIQVDPSLSEKEILQIVARNVAEFLDAEFADVWIFDSEWKHLTSFGREGSIAEVIPLEDIIAEEVIKTQKSYCIPDILKEEKWRNKKVALRHGIHSGLFVRVANPRFSMKKKDPEGVLRIFLERVLDNLFNNASNAIPEEGGEISIRSYCKEEWAMAEITNTGQISEEAKGRFIREDGIGRGLDSVSRFVRSMGGKVEVDTKEGQTTFRVMLPVAER